MFIQAPTSALVPLEAPSTCSNSTNVLYRPHNEQYCGEFDDKISCRPLYSSNISSVNYYTIMASLTLFANTLQNPRDSMVPSDVKLMKYVTKSLEESFLPSLPQGKSLLVETFQAVDRITEDFVAKTQYTSPMRSKRRSRDEDQEAVRVSFQPFFQAKTYIFRIHRIPKQTPQRRPPNPLHQFHHTHRHSLTLASSSPACLPAALL